MSGATARTVTEKKPSESPAEKSLLDETGLSDAQRARFLELVETARPEWRIRALISKQLGDLIESEAGPDAARDYAAFSQGLGEPHAFSWMPFEHFLLRLAKMTSLVWPEKKLDDAFCDGMERLANRFFEQPYAGALLKAGGDDPAKLAELAVTLPDFFVDFGERSFEAIDESSCWVHFDEFMPAELGAALAPGFFRGLIAATGHAGDMTIEERGDYSWSGRLEWT